MKKWICAIGLAVCILALAACGNGGQALSLDVDSAAEQMAVQGSFDEPLEKIGGDIAMKIYQLEPDAVAGSAVYTGTAAVVDEVSVWEARDAAAVKTVEQAVRARLESQKESYASYRPEEVPKLDAAVIVSKGNYVALCVSKDSEKAKTVLEGLLK